MRCTHIDLLGYAAKNEKPQFDGRPGFTTTASVWNVRVLWGDTYLWTSIPTLMLSDARLQYRPQVRLLCPPRHSIIRLGDGIFVDDIRLVCAVSTALGR